MTTSCLQTPTQYSLDIALPKFATFETFIDASDSQLLSVLKQLSQTSSTEPRQYFLWGSAGTGKTHLLQAICNHQVNTPQNAIYLPMKELVDQQAAILNDMHQLDVVCIDDVDAVLGNKEWDRQLFLLINELRASNKSIVITATNNPHEAPVSFPDLASRLVWGPVYKLSVLSDNGKSRAIQEHAKVRGLEVSTEVCSFLLKRFPRDLNKLISLLDKLDEESLVQQKKVTVPFVKTVLNIE
ncbi:MAG: DnaA regulatory inactivator Hda [Gammaproteobacteria bacterium]